MGTVLNNTESYSRLGFKANNALLFANRPSAAQYANQIVFFSDIGTNGSHFVSNGTYWSPLGGEVTLAMVGTTYAVTGTATETVLSTYTLPAGLLTPNSQLDIMHTWTYTNSANSKTVRIKHSSLGGGTGGDAYYSVAATTSLSLMATCSIRSNNSTSAQKGWGVGNTVPSGLSAIASTLRSFSRSTSVATDIVFTGQLANTGETITLSGYTIVLKG